MLPSEVGEVAWLGVLRKVEEGFLQRDRRERLDASRRRPSGEEGDLRGGRALMITGGASGFPR